MAIVRSPSKKWQCSRQKQIPPTVTPGRIVSLSKQYPNGTLQNGRMKCPRCNSSNDSNASHKNGKPRCIYKDCCRQFVEHSDRHGYGDEVKDRCLTLYVSDLGFRAVNTVRESTMTWLSTGSDREASSCRMLHRPTRVSSWLSSPNCKPRSVKTTKC